MTARENVNDKIWNLNYDNSTANIKMTCQRKRKWCDHLNVSLFADAEWIMVTMMTTLKWINEQFIVNMCTSINVLVHFGMYVYTLFVMRMRVSICHSFAWLDLQMAKEKKKERWKLKWLHYHHFIIVGTGSLQILFNCFESEEKHRSQTTSVSITTVAIALPTTNGKQSKKPFRKLHLSAAMSPFDELLFVHCTGATCVSVSVCMSISSVFDCVRCYCSLTTRSTYNAESICIRFSLFFLLL